MELINTLHASNYVNMKRQNPFNLNYSQKMNELNLLSCIIET